MDNLASEELSESLYDAFERAGIEAEMWFLASEFYANSSEIGLPYFNEFFPAWLKEQWGFEVALRPFVSKGEFFVIYSRWSLISYENEELLLMFKLKYG